mmetsp:Transcript_100788/g.194865  ORF Transcript_100788/g.194865 Transcript_100788/m.194865 type:complete len:94 (-) Transcript_100788:722-1003(-)
MLRRALAGLAAFAGQPAALDPTCFGFPNVEPSPNNHASVCPPFGGGCGDKGLGVRTGDVAPDFTLSTLDGVVSSLSAHLAKGKPVVMQFGAFT